MVKFGMKAVLLSLSLSLLVPLPVSAATDKTTKFRVYQNDQLLMEFADYAKAESYARSYSNSRVEEIGSGAWRWNNYPRYQVYQSGHTVPEWSFAKLEDAIKEASKWGHASIRDLQGVGWVWNNYPRYRLYQGDATADSWLFTSLPAATAEAKRWSNAHIIDLTNNRWVWDNLPAAKKKELRSGQPSYQVYQGTYTQDSWRFAYLEDAVNEALNWGNSRIVRLADQSTVYENAKPYKVYQNDTYLDEFVSLDQAADYARLWAHASIRLDGEAIWNNEATYTVYQGTNRIGDFYTPSDALQYAKQYSNASIRTLNGNTIWNNFRKLQLWAWNGSSAKDTILKQTAGTMGLDVDSPTWFQLADADGGLKDTSSKETVELLRKQGLQVHPLVSNQFDSALTTAFLSNKDAQARFIAALVKRAAELNVQGINVDFESISGKDRAPYTEFLTKLTEAAHAQALKISVDLPRGSVKWNHQTAYDHEKLGGIVDYIITMTYDQHYAGSTVPGSVAGLSWIEEGIKEFLSYGIPRDKLIMGIPFYVREWTLDASGALVSNRAIYTKDLSSILSSRSTVSAWDPAFGQYKIEYKGDDGNKKVFWLENADTLQARLAVAKKYELAGVAAWRLGQEDPAFWQTMLQAK
ncbi:glycosyl hydrolase family 18 protein [Gorillibacterium sp. sgz5001074]|uniref:glycosyl hydrolase family 18 protein n=1 Tax=Gorillibacterium sp. sgz5001074 TaxID=3446695 RepID=UPI003F67CD8A